MPYSKPSDAPAYVPEDKKAQWIAVWNSAYKAAKKKGMSDKDAEASAFAQANGVIKKQSKSGEDSMMERRFLKGTKVTLRAGENPAIEGYASVFNEKYDSGWFIETIKPGAFARALREKQDVRCLFNHDPNNLLGRTKSGTLSLREDTSGLQYTCEINPEMRMGMEVHAMIQRGDLDGCSFGFKVCKQTWREEKDGEGKTTQYRDIEDVDLFDVSVVTYPAYDGTSVGARALAMFPEGIPEEIRSHVPALREMKPGAPMGDTPGNPGDGEGGEAEPDDDDKATYMMAPSMMADHFQQGAEHHEDMAKTHADHATFMSALYRSLPDGHELKAFAKRSADLHDSKAALHDARAQHYREILESEKPKVLAKIKAAAEAHGIDVSESKSAPLSLEQAKARTETLRAEMSLV